MAELIGPQPEYPPARAWPRTPGTHHVQADETAHPVSECTDTCRAVGGPYVARPGWVVRVQAFMPLHGSHPDGHQQTGDGNG